MFGQRVKEILTLFRVSAAELARIADCDPSYISRMASGARTPKPGGAGVQRLIEAIFTYGDEHGTIPLLCRTVSCDPSLSAEEIKARTSAWLYEGETDLTPAPPRKKVPYRAFGQRLSAVMELEELSNVRLGKRINLDASYISRFRSGLRSPLCNPATGDALCAVLLERAAQQDRTRQLAVLTGISPEDLTDEDGALSLFRTWLFGAEEEADTAPLAEKLLENIDAFSFEPRPFPSAPAPEFPRGEDRTVYYGTDGLQKAVIRFLSAVAESAAKELCLYSDQSTEWMSDPPFRAAWAAGMLNCVRQGVQIRIIHNVDRNPDEMIDAITNWLPLYMTGAIESYYSEKQRNPRFSNTLFLCPGVACICGGNPAGTEKESGVYRYDAAPDLLAAHRAAFERLAAESKPLVRTVRGVNADLSSFAGTGRVTVLGTTLSAVTLPEETLQALLDRGGLPEEEQKKQRAGWEARRKAFLNDLHTGSVHECIPTASEEALLSGAVPADLPDLKLTYTPREYAEHVNQILRFSEEYPGYRFFPLPDAAFANTKILISDAAVAVIRLKEPRITFMISHPAMCRAFSAYAQRIENRFRRDRITLRRDLQRYL